MVMTIAGDSDTCINGSRGISQNQLDGIPVYNVCSVLLHQPNTQRVAVDDPIRCPDCSDYRENDGYNRQSEKQENADNNQAEDERDHRVDEHGNVEVQGFPGMIRNAGADIISSDQINNEWADQAKAEDRGEVKQHVPQLVA